MSPRHANFVVNEGRATSTDVLALLIAAENVLDVDEEIDLVLVRNDRDQQLAADSANDRRRREERVRADVHDAADGVEDGGDLAAGSR